RDFSQPGRAGGSWRLPGVLRCACEPRGPRLHRWRIIVVKPEHLSAYAPSNGGKTMSHFTRRITVAALAALASLSIAPALAQGANSITVASTTSTQDSGLFTHILPL